MNGWISIDFVYCKSQNRKLSISAVNALLARLRTLPKNVRNKKFQCCLLFFLQAFLF